MGFYLQLKLLLWKNFTLKKRKPIVLLFELVIPLVLFFILIGIRKKQPAYAVKTKHFAAWPLPSSGVISVMQAFCDRGPMDNHGFYTYPNASVAEFLTQLNAVAENNNFFRPGFTVSQLGEIPAIYKSIVEDPIALRKKFENTMNMTLESVLNDKSSFKDYLISNLSLASTSVDIFLKSSVNTSQLYKLLFGSPSQFTNGFTKKQKRSVRTFEMDDNFPFKDFGNYSLPTNEYEFPSFGLFYDEFFKEQSNKVLWKLLSSSLSLQSMMNGMDYVSKEELIFALKTVLFSGSAMKKTVCNTTDVLDLVNCMGEGCTEKLSKMRHMFCYLNDSQIDTLSDILQQSINTSAVIHVLSLEDWNVHETKQKVMKLAEDLHIFTVFEKTLKALSKLAESLPQDACVVETDENNSTISNNTESNTGSPIDESEDEPHKNNRPQYGLLRIWQAMQKTVCGKEIQDPEKLSTTEEISFENMGISKYQREQIGILVHILYSNPKVLFSPNNTAAYTIIKKANETFALLDIVGQYAEKILNVSVEIEAFLSENTTDDDLLALQNIKKQLTQFPVFLNLTNSPQIREFVQNVEVPDKKTFHEQLSSISNAACSWNSLMTGLSLNIFQGFQDEKNVLEYFQKKAYSDNVTVLASVIFQLAEDGTLPNHMIYKIRQNASFISDTNLVRSRFWFPGPRNWGYVYYHFGFVWIQDILERAMVSLQVGRDVNDPGSYIHEFPSPCYMEDQFLFMIRHVMPLCLSISWVYSVSMLVQSIVHEKEQRLKEVMKMMGLANGVHWLAWFITSLGQMSISVCLLTVILKYGKVLTYSDTCLIFFILELFAVAIIMFSFLVSVFFSKAKLAAACAGIVYFLSYVPYMYISVREESAHDVIPVWLKSLASFLAPTAFGLGSKYFAFYEEIGVGAQWSNIAVSPVEADKYTLYNVAFMLFVDILVYGLLVWYIENVHPGAYGLPKPWYFPVMKSYWLGKTNSEEDCSSCFKLWAVNPLSVMENDQACALTDNHTGILFEQEPTHLKIGVCIDGLSKKYKGSTRHALNSLNLNLYEGQITSLLGHNGAGKTTTMSILTGLFPPTSGYAIIYGHDIRTSMDQIRKSLGMCPQHNVLFDQLTIAEHLWFYSRLKGTDSLDIDKEMDKLLVDLGLPRKKHDKVECLSGGMKRKLSVAIAFVGGSRTVILDEPTAGVDPYARRAIWDLILKYKKGRTILLSTHHMDEADILGDRVAIMSNGKLKCCGTALFLKNSLGDGYHLYIVKQQQPLLDTDVDVLYNDSFNTLCSEDEVTNFLQRKASTAFLLEETKHELHYVLPVNELKMGNFEKLFRMLEKNKELLHIKSYGIKNTTLEEVFLKLSEESAGDISSTSVEDSDNSTNECSQVPNDQTRAQSSSSSSQKLYQPKVNFDKPSNRQIMEMIEVTKEVRKAVTLNHFSDNKLQEGSNSVLLDDLNVDEFVTPCRAIIHKPMYVEGSGTYKLEGKWLYLRQFCAILVKRYYCTRRNWKGLFSQILLPAFFVSIAMSVALTAPKIEDLPPLTLSPSQYYNSTQPNGNVIPYANNKMDLHEPKFSVDADSDRLAETLHYPSGVAATCVLKSPYNNTFDLTNMNLTVRNFQMLSAYFQSNMCESVFVPGLPLENFVPPAPTMRPVISTDNDILNLTQWLSTPQSLVDEENRFYPTCHCGLDKTGYVCRTSGYSYPKHYKVVTGDILMDISAQNETEYYLYTTDMYRLRRYGALSFGHSRSFVPLDFGRNAPGLFRKIAKRHAAVVWYNHKGYHSVPTYVNTLNNAILRANLPPEKGNPSAYGITVINHPLPDTQTSISKDQILQGTDVLIAIFIIVAMSFVPASFVLFLVHERYTKAKHLQVVSGVNRLVYWIANYFWDMCNYTVPATCCVLILKIFDIPAYTSDKNFPAVVSLFLMYGWSITPMMYPASFVFKEPSSAYIFLIVINLFIGITCVVTSFLLEVFSYDKYLGQIHHLLKSVFLVFPNYCLGRGLMDIAFNEYHNYFLFKTGQYHEVKSPFEWDLVPRNLVSMAVVGITFFLITLLCEFNFFFKPRRCQMPSFPTASEDEDVCCEKRRVIQGHAQTDLLLIENVTKVYRTHKMGKQLAVDRLCIGVPAGECFGLLGVNGAGKTSTFRMLTGDTSITGGDAFINGFSVCRELPQVQQYIGYCPQFDALYDELTAREHLTLYARFRGIPPKEEHGVVEWALKKLDLVKYADRPSATYSGGNKRKLSTAIALLGGPPVIFLDEPTTGMDPYSRRFLWDLIGSLVHSGRSIVLTSHSMEECEALCTRMAIMVNGHFKCLGSIQHLKNRFGDGYSINLRTDEIEHRLVEAYIMRVFPEASLKEKHHNMLQYELTSDNISLAYVFKHMERAMQDLRIDDYSVSQNTLDNVFINFVKQQSDQHSDIFDGESRRKRSSCTNSQSSDDVLMDVMAEEDNPFEKAKPHLELMPDATM